jgi:excisionase family DNA binding protein
VDTSKMIGPKELAEWLDVPVQTVYRWQHTGVGPRSFKVGRHLRFARADVLAWLSQQQVSPGPPAA